MKEEVTGDYYNIAVVTVKRNESNCRRTAAAEGKMKLTARESQPKLSNGSGDPSAAHISGKTTYAWHKRMGKSIYKISS